MSEGDSAVHLYGRRRRGRGIVSHAVTVRVVTICTWSKDSPSARSGGVSRAFRIRLLFEPFGKSIIVPSLSTSLQAENGHEASLLRVSPVLYCSRVGYFHVHFG